MQRINIIVFIIALLVAGLLIWQIPKWQLKITKNNDSGEKHINLENELRKTVAQIFGGLLVLIGLYFTYEQLVAARVSIQVSQQTQLTDEYSKAVEQLGNNSSQIRLGGIYALQRLEENSDTYTSIVKNVLSMYIRQKSKLPDSSKFDEIQAALTVIFPKVSSHDTTKTSDRINLSNSFLLDFDFSGSYLCNVKMDNCVCSGSSFKNAVITSSKAYGTNFNAADFSAAKISNTVFYGADFPGAVFRNASIINCNFKICNLKECDLSNSVIEHTDFTGADLTGALLFGADLSKSFGITKEQIAKAQINQLTKLPIELKQ
jgi:uncharacterized protein YjbI with pentapeptide repeats